MMGRGIRRFAVLAVLVMGAACVPLADRSTQQMPGEPSPGDQATAPRPASAPVPAPIHAAEPAGPATFIYEGALEQGGWVRGQAPAGTRTARLGDTVLTLDEDGRFFAGFDRDADTRIELVATLADGRTLTTPVTIAPRAWNIERVNVARRPGGPSAAFLERRRPELERIVAARARDTGAKGWRQAFRWPATGRISGRFGSQRIYRGGEAGSYHSGIDIARPTGTPFVAPADGVVVLASGAEFSLEGLLLIVDHGQGLNSAFLHMNSIAVEEGESVRQGQVLGTIGASGRATGPHLHWGLTWRGARLDPLLFTGPMP